MKGLGIRLRAGLVAVLLVGLGPTAAEAAKLGFRNDGPTPVVVQSTIAVRGAVQRGKPLVIQAGQTATYDTHPPGNTVITVYDGTIPNRVLFQGPLVVGNDDLYFSIKPDPMAPKAKVEPIKPPADR